MEDERGEQAGQAEQASKARLFVAVLLPDEVSDALERIERPEVPGVRWTRRDQWHVTLRFFGQADIAGSKRALDSVEARSVSCIVGPKVERLGRHVLALPVHGLDELAAKVVEATRHVGRPPENRPFRGHVTLARVKGRDFPLLGAALEASFVADSLVLMKSTLSRSGARYEVMHRVQLSGT